jgi:glycine betaine transporter
MSYWEGGIMFDRILLAVDFSRHSVMAMKMAAAMCEGSARKLYVLSVCDTADNLLHQGVFGTSDRALNISENTLLTSITSQLDELCLPMDTMKLHYSKLIKTGSPTKVILDTAKQYACDLIVMGSHSKLTILDNLMGGTTQSVIRKSHCPVLVASPPESSAQPDDS